MKYVDAVTGEVREFPEGSRRAVWFVQKHNANGADGWVGLDETLSGFFVKSVPQVDMAGLCAWIIMERGLWQLDQPMTEEEVVRLVALVETAGRQAPSPGEQVMMIRPSV